MKISLKGRSTHELRVRLKFCERLRLCDQLQWEDDPARSVALLAAIEKHKREHQPSACRAATGDDS